ncbi:MAG: glycine cleavage system protein T [Chloroflexota bacterium]
MTATYLFDRSNYQGRLELTDRDRLDLLHRMSTNDLLKMQLGEGRSTVLTTANARIIDRVIVYHRGETALMLANQPAVVRTWLQRYIFFQDKVKIRDVSAELGQLEIYGSQAAEIAESIAPGASGLALHSFIDVPESGLLIARTFPMLQDGFILIVPVAALESWQQAVQQHGATIGDEARYEMLRIEAGLPGTGHELTEDYIPLEANLWDSVSFAKGCYIGQEIIARMESRNRLAKTLVHLNMATVAPLGSRLTEDDRAVGTLTSIAQRDDGTIIGLGFVKPELAVPGTHLNIATADDQADQVTITVEVTAPTFVR